MNGTRTHRFNLLLAVGTAFAGLAPLASDAAAQQGGSGVVVQVRQESTSRNVAMENMANQAGAAGVDASMLSMIFSQMTGALEGGIAEAGLGSQLPAGLMTKLKVGGHLAAHEIAGGLEDARTPETESSDYTIYIRPDVFKMTSAELTMFWKPAGAGDGGGMWYTDPSSGRLVPLNLGQVDAFVGDAAEHSGMEITPLPGAPTKEILGHTAHGYGYAYTMDLSMGGMLGAGAGLPVSAENVVEGEAWIARDMPQRNQIAAFYRNFAAGFGQGGMMGGLLGGMADLAALGVPLETTQTVRTFVNAALGGEEQRFLMMEGTSSSIVTDISDAVLTDEALFGPGGSPVDLAAAEAAPAATQVPGAAPAPGAEGAAKSVCDCGCDAFEELQDMDEDDPDAMAKAMCARQCAMKWMRCAQP